MVVAWLALLWQGVEFGLWFAGWRSLRRDHSRDWLVWGRPPAITLPLIDTQLEQRVGVPTRMQTRTANAVVRATRWGVRTRAFELLVLTTVRDRWPFGRQRLDTEVKLWV